MQFDPCAKKKKNTQKTEEKLFYLIGLSWETKINTC